MDALPRQAILDGRPRERALGRGGLTSPHYQVGLEAPHAERQFADAPREGRDALRRQARRLRDDPQAGTFLPVRTVPNPALRRWRTRIGQVERLYKLDLPKGWRALYVVRTEGAARVVLVIELLSHTDYERLLGYG